MKSVSLHVWNIKVLRHWVASNQSLWPGLNSFEAWHRFICSCFFLDYIFISTLFCLVNSLLLSLSCISCLSFSFSFCSIFLLDSWAWRIHIKNGLSCLCHGVWLLCMILLISYTWLPTKDETSKRRLYGIRLLRFLPIMVPCMPKLDDFCV